MFPPLPGPRQSLADVDAARGTAPRGPPRSPRFPRSPRARSGPASRHHSEDLDKHLGLALLGNSSRFQRRGRSVVCVSQSTRACATEKIGDVSDRAHRWPVGLDRHPHSVAVHGDVSGCEKRMAPACSANPQSPIVLMRFIWRCWGALRTWRSWKSWRSWRASGRAKGARQSRNSPCCVRHFREQRALRAALLECERPPKRRASVQPSPTAENRAASVPGRTRFVRDPGDGRWSHL